MYINKIYVKISLSRTEGIANYKNRKKEVLFMMFRVPFYMLN